MDLPFLKKNDRMVKPGKEGRNYVIIQMILWLSTTYMYKLKRYNVDKSLTRLLLFSMGSFFASYGYASLFDPPLNKAIRLNNKIENNFQKALQENLG